MRKVNLKDAGAGAKSSRESLDAYRGTFGRARRSRNRWIYRTHPFDLALVRIPKGNRFVRITRMRRNRSFISPSGQAACATRT
jgi:hypothetical protein